MSVTVLSKEIQYSFFKWDTTLKDMYTLRSRAWICIPILHNGHEKKMLFSFEPGFISDGLSVPWIFRWFLKNWDKDNDLYNLAGVVHDALYGRKGYNIFTREECDDIFRGLLRISGKSRFKASTADFLLGIFGHRHWGLDDHNCNDKCAMTFV